MSILRFLQDPYTRLALNCLFALGNAAVGFFTRSWWFITAGAYYAILAVTRFSVLQVRRKAGGNPAIEQFATRMTGILLVVLSCTLIGVNVLSIIEERGTAYHEIVMIGIAAYTFTKITVAIIGLGKSRKILSPTVRTLRNISLADAAVSVYSLQRSMLVSFPGMAAGDIRLLNILTGSAVWVVVIVLGINLIEGRFVTMAKSKLAKANEKIADAVVGGYKKIEKGVVDGYKAVESGVVGGYKKLEDKFVDTYLTKEGETIEEAKERLKKQGK